MQVEDEFSVGRSHEITFPDDSEAVFHSGFGEADNAVVFLLDGFRLDFPEVRNLLPLAFVNTRDDIFQGGFFFFQTGRVLGVPRRVHAVSLSSNSERTVRTRSPGISSPLLPQAVWT